MFKEKIDSLMSENKIKSLKELSRNCSLPYSTFTRIYYNGVETAESQNIKKIADYFGCTFDYLQDNNIKIDNKLHRYKKNYSIWKRADINLENQENILKELPIEIVNYLDLNYWYHPNEEEINNGITDYSNYYILNNLLNSISLLEDGKKLNEQELKVVINFILSNLPIIKKLLIKSKEEFLKDKEQK